jgi:hypothetical protein
MAAPGKVGRIKGLRRVFVAPLQTDTAATTAYGTAIMLGAQAELTFQENEETEELKSAIGVENSVSKVLSLTWGLKFGEKNLSVLDLLRGGKLWEDATGGQDVYVYANNAQGGYFGIFAQPELVEGGPLDYWVCLAKCKLEGSQARTMGGPWMMNDLSGRAFYTLKDKILWGEAFLTAVTDITADAVLTSMQSAVASGT